MRFYIYFVYLLFLGGILALSSCKKPLSFSTENLSFSADTVIFDTVFTTVGSTTKKLKIYNNDSKTLAIEQIELVGGANSPFRINVDGLSGTNFADLEMEGNDSLYIFVEVTLDPNNQLNPMVIEDQIRFRTNGTDQFVQLVAWGQDMYFHVSDIPGNNLDTNEGTWPNDKPHVIYNYAFIDSAKILTIQAGTDIYLHKGAILYNYKGTLNIEGTLNEPVTFQGDRLESYYDDVSGQYYGIYMQEARPSKIDYAIIKNGTSGIHMFSEDAGNSGYTLELSNSIIENNASYGIFLYSGAKIKAENCVIAKNGVHSFLVLEGGDFNFNHCTILSYGNGQNQGAAVGISNYYNDPLTATQNIGSINEGTITNSVIYGYADQELAIDTVNFGGVMLNFQFDYNLIRSEEILTGSGFDAFTNYWNQEPLFVSITNRDFHFWSNSPLNNAGASGYPVTNIQTSGRDLEGTSRATGPDIGAYEKQ
jgi:hypothetical protein